MNSRKQQSPCHRGASNAGATPLHTGRACASGKLSSELIALARLQKRTNDNQEYKHVIFIR